MTRRGRTKLALFLGIPVLAIVLPFTANGHSDMRLEIHPDRT